MLNAKKNHNFFKIIEMAKMTDLTCPYPQDHNDLSSKLKDLQEETNKLDMKSKTFYDYSTFCKKRYYNSFLKNFAKDGSLDYGQLRNFSVSFARERDAKNQLGKSKYRTVSLRKDPKGIVNPKVTIYSDKDYKWRKLVSFFLFLSKTLLMAAF